MKIVLIVASIETTCHRLKSVFDRVMGGLLGALGHEATRRRWSGHLSQPSRPLK
jgi:hypothetical protein